jgi:imidazolonepropionase-like amidohydrolase
MKIPIEEYMTDTRITVFENSRIFDGYHERLIEGCSLVVEGNRIKAVMESSANDQQGSDQQGSDQYSGAQRIDCGGRVLMPGLIDAHMHAYTPTYSVYDNDRMPPALMSSYARVHLEGCLQRGFTTVRDAAGGDIGLSLALKKGLINGPRFFYSGKAISQTGGHGDIRPTDRVEPCGCSSYSGSGFVVADGADAVRKAVREELRKGAHQIKLFVSGGVTSPSDPVWMNQLTEAEIRAAVEEAATRRTYVMAHCHTDESVRRCVAFGVRSIEHGSDISEATAELIAEKGVYVVPTLSVMKVIRQQGNALGLADHVLKKIDGLYEKTLASISRCAQVGVKLGLGSDLLSHETHPLQGGELALRGEVSKPVDVLRSATSINAEILQKVDELGCIKAGAYADILVVEGNPLQDLSLFQQPEQNIAVIMKDGVLVQNAIN